MRARQTQLQSSIDCSPHRTVSAPSARTPAASSPPPEGAARCTRCSQSAHAGAAEHCRSSRVDHVEQGTVWHSRQPALDPARGGSSQGMHSHPPPHLWTIFSSGRRSCITLDVANTRRSCLAIKSGETSNAGQLTLQRQRVGGLGIASGKRRWAHAAFNALQRAALLSAWATKRAADTPSQHPPDVLHRGMRELHGLHCIIRHGQIELSGIDASRWQHCDPHGLLVHAGHEDVLIEDLAAGHEAEAT